METSQQIPVNAGHGRKKLWLALVILTGCCAAWIVFVLCYTSVHPDSFITSAANAFGRRFSDSGEVNNNQINISHIKNGEMTKIRTNNSSIINSRMNNTQMNKSQINNNQITETTSFTDHNCSRYVAFENFPGSGLGNQMFYFAAALHVSELTGREVVLFHNVRNLTLSDAFDLNVRVITQDECPKYDFKASTVTFDANLEKSVVNNSETVNKLIFINGYFQSWRYLRFIKDRVRHHFKLRPDTRQVVTTFFQANIPPGWTEDFLRVGIHVRRGDFLKLTIDGYSVGTEEYFQKAMKYFVEKYGRTQFIVASLDKEWTKKFIYFNDSALANVTFSFGHTCAQDMAILSMCDHVIVSTGTFGWWSAWLAGGTTVYYANFPSRNSSLFKDMTREDYYPANWIPME